MQKCQHIGRVSIAFSNTPVDAGSALDFKPQPFQINFDKLAFYLPVGGLGGLGRAVPRWVVERSAQELVYLSRSAGESPEVLKFVEKLSSTGCEMHIVAGDVTKLEDVVKATSAASRPLRGVLQMSMVLRDAKFTEMSFEDWSVVLASKVKEVESITCHAVG